MPVKLNNLSPTIKPLSTTWVLKKKEGGDFRARITVQGFLQEEGVHFQGDLHQSQMKPQLHLF
jgi:hypothetical protein